MMDIKQILLSDASTDAKLSALAILIDKQFPKLENKVLEVEKLQGPVGDKGDKGDQGPQGERGKDGKDGKNGSNGKDGVDGKDGENGVSIDGVKIDFDGSLVVTLTDGRVINVGEIVPIDVAEKIRTVHNIQIGSGGDSQTVLDAIAALQATIATYGTMATQNANNVAITGGTINNTTIGATTPSTGVFTTLTATGQTSLGGAAGSEGLRVLNVASTVNYIQARGHITANAPSIRAAGSDTNIGLGLSSQGTGAISFYSSSISSEQMRVSHTPSAVNYVQVTGAATGGAVAVTAQGSDTNVQLTLQSKGAGTVNLIDGSNSTGLRVTRATAGGDTFLDVQRNVGLVELKAASGVTNGAFLVQSKGTGAIDLAAGSKGVNISNGGTVTAITRTANGSGYTGVPSVAISAPTTAGGVQATATVRVLLNSATVANGGTGYTVGDVLTISGATGPNPNARLNVTAVSGGVITAVTVNATAIMDTVPSNPASFTGGTGSGATFNCLYVIENSFTITNAGSGYVEQPTVTFSGGGGSGAAAYATVGSGTVVRSLGSTISFYTPAGEQARVSDSGNTPDAYVSLKGASSTSGGVYITAAGAVRSMYLSSGSGASIRTYTGGEGTNEQLRIAHTASAVNYVQVTGGATTIRPTISAQGSDVNLGLSFTTKGTGRYAFFNNSAQSSSQFSIGLSGLTTAVNYLNVNGAAAGSAPAMTAEGNDTNIDLNLTPKGTGGVVLGNNQANYADISGGATTKAVEFNTLGSDTNVAVALRSKGTGAIDLAAGSSGVNISNGGTVTALTVTNGGTVAYTSTPSVAITAPTTAGGVQATASATMRNTGTPAVAFGGTGYTVGDTLTVVGGTSTIVITFTVATVSAGVITSVTALNQGQYTVLPSNPVSVTGGTGTGATFNLSFIVTLLTITNAGSGYVEQPTVTFSGGGGSGAAAYATVGAGTIIRSLGATGAQSIDFQGASSINTSVPTFRIRDAGGNSFLMAGSATDTATLFAQGATNAVLTLASNGTQSVRIGTNGSSTVEQLRVSHTASAVNYVQVTGNITSNSPQISFTGSDAGVGGALIAKGNGAISFFNNGATTSRQFRVGAGVVTTAVNYINADGSATGNATQFQTLGTDTNIAMALRTSGTGAIDLAAGSSGVNISNGGTVTAITRTASGSAYTSVPSVAITAPTTAGGVQATASVGSMFTNTATVQSGGTGYTNGDVLTIVGGTAITSAATYTVTGVSGGAVTSVTPLNFNQYSVLPTNPVSTTGGTGSGATLNLTYGIGTVAFTITNAGSGYVEQPTVTFSGGGGSGAAAYATVGSDTLIRSLGQNIAFTTPNGRTSFRVVDLTGGTSTGYWNALGGTGSPQLRATGGSSGVILTESAVPLQFSTASVEQLRVSHTASAVNYVQVTGAATGSSVVVSSQGSDTNIGMIYNFKGTASHSFNGNNGTHFQVTSVASGANFLRATGAAASSAPVLSAQGSDTNIDLTLTPKGTGNVRFGTYTGTILTPTGYVEIKDSGGTVRRLLVG